MAVIDFPASPVAGASFTAPNGVTYVYTGIMWIGGTQPPLGPLCYEAHIGVDMNITVPSETWATIVTLPNIGVVPGKYLIEGGMSQQDNIGVCWASCHTTINSGATTSGQSSITHYVAGGGLYLAAPPMIVTLSGANNVSLRGISHGNNNWTAYQGAFVSAKKVS